MAEQLKPVYLSLPNNSSLGKCVRIQTYSLHSLTLFLCCSAKNYESYLFATKEDKWLPHVLNTR